MWLLLTIPATIPDHDLAAAFGVMEATVHAIRWRLKQRGWTCRVSYGVYAVCNQPFTRQGHRDGRRAYHPACRPAAIKLITTELEQQRWERLTKHEQQTRLSRAQQHTKDKQAQTVGNDHNRMRRWQPWEDEAITAADAPPDHELALELGRTLYAVRGRRGALRDRQPG